MQHATCNPTCISLNACVPNWSDADFQQPDPSAAFHPHEPRRQFAGLEPGRHGDEPVLLPRGGHEAGGRQGRAATRPTCNGADVQHAACGMRHSSCRPRLNSVLILCSSGLIPCAQVRSPILLLRVRRDGAEAPSRRRVDKLLQRHVDHMCALSNGLTRHMCPRCPPSIGFKCSRWRLQTSCTRLLCRVSHSLNMRCANPSSASYWIDFRWLLPTHTACCMLHAACCMLHVARCTLHVARCLLHVTVCTLHVAC